MSTGQAPAYIYIYCDRTQGYRRKAEICGQDKMHKLQEWANENKYAITLLAAFEISFSNICTESHIPSLQKSHSPW